MNNLRSIIFLSLRGYASKRPRRTRRAVQEPDLTPKMVERELYEDVDENDFDPANFDDGSKYESDFSEANQTYTAYMREQLVEKKKLKTRIIARKYFKSDDPNFLTWTEREEIKSLHKKDPEEWTTKRLSEAFPALPETIYKILNSHWLPRTSRVVLKYDNKVIENWNLFKSGNLALSPRLEEHLQKFKGRTIVPADLETIAKKFVKPRPVFPDPKATLFTNLVAGVIESKEAPKDALQITAGEEKNYAFENLKMNPTRKVTFDTFLKQTMNQITDKKNLSMEMEVLIDEYKKDKSEKVLEELRSRKPLIDEAIAGKIEEPIETPVGNKGSTCSDGQRTTGEALARSSSSRTAACEGKEPSGLQELPEESKSLEESEQKVRVTYVDVPKLNIEESSPLTGIIEWKKKKICGDDDYPMFIKVPNRGGKKTITFRVEDRYYDYDGEFLYRVPALRS